MAAFHQRLLGWFQRHQRQLPWRQTQDPWAIWVSEVMLQQTRVEAVQEIYPRFLASYPNPAAWAQVDDDQLLAAWRGLGYYRRARLLRAGAQEVQEKHGGQVPADLQALAQLPGIGAYTQGALASIAFQMPVIAVDGNVERVAARHRGIRQDVKRGPGARAVREAAAAWLDHQQPGDFNQALMELGAMICRPRSPRCQDCPVSEDCVAKAESLQGQLPILPPRRSMVNVQAQAVLVPVGDRGVLAHRLAPGAINAGQLDLPGPGILVSHEAGEALAQALNQCYGLRFAIEGEAAQIRHGITHHRISLSAHWASIQGKPKPPLLVADPLDGQVPWTTAARKVFAKAGIG